MLTVHVYGTCECDAPARAPIPCLLELLDVFVLLREWHKHLQGGRAAVWRASRAGAGMHMHYATPRADVSAGWETQVGRMRGQGREGGGVWCVCVCVCVGG